MIKKTVIIVILFFSFFLAGAQNWAPVSNKIVGGALETVLYDSIHNEIIVSDNQFINVGSLPTRGIARWNGTRWDSLAGGINTHDIQLNPNNPNGEVLCGIPYNGKFLVGGYFYSIGGKNIKSLAFWDGVKWDSLSTSTNGFNSPGGGPPLVFALFKDGNKLYIAGGFDSIANKYCTGLATYDGTTFSPIVLPVPIASFLYILDVKKYKNEIYACGRFYDTSGDTLGHILRYNGVNWYSVGGGIHGSICDVRTMAIYNNELYVGGYFKKSAGNAGECLMKWDGSQWNDVGFGSQPNFGTVHRLVVHQNKLWAFGSFSFASYMYSTSAAVFDGTKWCAPQDTLNNFIYGAAIFNDSIYVGGNFTKSGGDTNVKYIAKLKDPNLYKSCNGVGIEEIEKNNAIAIYPNPTLNNLNISIEQYFKEGTKIEIVNILGQTILLFPYKNEIDVSSISNGSYILKIITTDGGTYHSKFIKQ